MVVRKVLNSLLPEGGRYGGQEGFKLIVTRRLPLWWSGRFQTHCYQKVAIMVVRKVLNSLLPEGHRYGSQEGFKLIVTRRSPLWWSGRF